MNRNPRRCGFGCRSRWQGGQTPLRSVDPEQLAALFDPVLLALSPQAFTLTGFERIEGVDYAQSWLVTTSDPLPPNDSANNNPRWSAACASAKRANVS